MPKVSGSFVSPFGFVKDTFHTARKGKQNRRRKRQNKSPLISRDSKTITGLTNDSDGSTAQQTDRDRTEILLSKELSHSNGSYKNDLVPNEPVYLSPFDLSPGHKPDMTTLIYLENQLALLKQEICEELREETNIALKQLANEIRREIKLNKVDICK